MRHPPGLKYGHYSRVCSEEIVIRMFRAVESLYGWESYDPRMLTIFRELMQIVAGSRELPYIVCTRFNEPSLWIC